jgi:hypothetical protein
MKLFEKYDMLSYDNKKGWHIANWDGRQFKSDNVSERVAKHRARKEEKELKRYSNVVDTDTDTDSYTDTEEESDSDLFKACQRIYERKKGALITDGQSFALMISNFESQGVTADDYAAAIDAMDSDKRYRGSKPTSYEKWALGIADKRKNPAKYSSDKRNRQSAEKLDPNNYAKAWVK